MASRGIVLFGINNARVDYIQLAVMAAAFIKRNMSGTNVCLITDAPSKEYHDGKGRWPLNNYFSTVITVPNEVAVQSPNPRLYRDTRYYSFQDSFNNSSRALAYKLSPYDETLLLDSDYLICSDALSKVWGSTEEIMINHKAIGLLHNELGISERRLNPYGIKMYWATAVYFKKGKKAKLLFDLVNFIRENWDFYKLSYDFPGSMFRNDYAFSIAIHMLSGFSDEGSYVSSLPDDTILTGLDTDQFFKLNSPRDLSLFVNDPVETWKFYVTRIKGLNVHCMNKLSLLNNMESIMGVLDE